MNTITKVLIGIIAIIFLGGILSCSYIMSVNNTCVDFETQIEAQYKKNQSTYDTFWKTVKETAQVPEMYANDVKNLYKEVMRGRYGADGSKAMFQFLKEANPNLDPGMYRSIQQAIESGRGSINITNQQLLSLKQKYDGYRKKFPTSIITSALGWPKIKLDDFDIVTSDETDKAFKTKKADMIKLK